MKLRRSRARKKGRIEIIPMIDVMFFLLATLMLASLSLQNLHGLAVGLPRGEATPLRVQAPLTLTVTKEGLILLNETPIALDGIETVLKGISRGADPDMVVNADAAAPNGIVVQAMLKARAAGIEHFQFAIKRP